MELSSRLQTNEEDNQGTSGNAEQQVIVLIFEEMC